MLIAYCQSYFAPPADVDIIFISSSCNISVFIAFIPFSPPLPLSTLLMPSRFHAADTATFAAFAIDFHADWRSFSFSILFRYASAFIFSFLQPSFSPSLIHSILRLILIHFHFH
jgi:hypothetical protein